MTVALRPAETTEIHTRMLRMGLAVDDSRTYWQHADRQPTVEAAFEQRWFGSRTMARVRYLVNNFVHRFGAFEPSVLRRLSDLELKDRAVICHWHVQFSDPLYRAFTGEVLPGRRNHPRPTIDRTTVVRFVDRQTEGRWASSTSQRMAAGLMACATEAGLCEGSAATRPLKLPRVSDLALGYLLHLLREVKFAGTLRENPYLASVEIDGSEWDERLRRMPGVEYRRAGDVLELQWSCPDLAAWAAEAL